MRSTSEIESQVSGTPRHVDARTPWVQVAQNVPATVLLLWIVSGGTEILSRSYEVTALVVLLIVGSIVTFRLLQWRNLTYWVDEDGDLRVDSGIMQKQKRRLQVSRLQSVDVTRPFVPRWFGLATVRVEAAGSGESRVNLAYMDLQAAEQLRDQLLALSAGVAGEAGTEGVPPVAPEVILARVNSSELLLSLLLRTSTASLLLVSVFFLTISFITEGAGGLLIAVITGGIPLASVFTEYFRNHNFTVATSPDGLRIRRGMTTTYSNTIPPGRVHAVGFVEGWLWRQLGWVRVELNLGGSPGRKDDSSATNVLMPIASKQEAIHLVEQLLPGANPDHVERTCAPQRSVWRAPFQWRNVSLGSNDEYVVMTNGWLTRHTVVVPHGRLQSVRITRGPLESALGLASLHIDSTPGPVVPVAPHIDGEFARGFAEAQVERSRSARAAAAPERWMLPG